MAVELHYPRALVALTVDLDGEAEPLDVVVIPRRVTLTRRPHTHADTADIELGGAHLPFDPRTLRSVVATVFLGEGRTLDDMGWRSEATRRFIGFADTFDTEQEDDDVLTLKVRDLSATLRDAKPLPPDACPHYGDSLETAIARILDETPGGEALDLYFTDDAGDVPIGGLVSARMRSGPIHLEPNMTAWGAIEYVAGLANRLVTVELDRVVVRLPREVYANTQNPRASLVFNAETANLTRLTSTKKFIRNRKGIRCVSFDPATRTRLEFDYPPDSELPSRRRAPATRRARRAAPKPPERDVFPVQGVTTLEGLREVAQGIWQQRSRQEIALAADTPYFTEPFLGMRPGDRVRIQLNRALAAGLNGLQSRPARVAYVARRLGLDRRTAEILVNAAEHPGTDLFYVHEVTLKWSPEGDIGAHLELINMIEVGAQGVA